MPRASQRRPPANERELVALFNQVFGGRRAPASRRDLVVGIGDDAAVLRVGAGDLVWTVDTNVEGVHFDARWLSWEDVGFRSFQAAASDLAAMAAEPLAALSALIVPAHLTLADIDSLARGQAEAARELGCPVVGGNVARGRELSVTTTVLGRSRAPVVRSQARAGDEVWLVGEVGLAAAGLRLLQAGKIRSSRASACIERWRRPRALIERGLALAGRASAMMDVSDGLSRDAERLAEASGVSLVLEAPALERVLSDELGAAARLLRLEPLTLAVQGGEDYALLATGPRARRPRWATRIGRVESGQGLHLETEPGRSAPVMPGFDHFEPNREHHGEARPGRRGRAARR